MSIIGFPNLDQKWITAALRILKMGGVPTVRLSSSSHAQERFYQLFVPNRIQKNCEWPPPPRTCAFELQRDRSFFPALPFLRTVTMFRLSSPVQSVRQFAVLPQKEWQLELQNVTFLYSFFYSPFPMRVRRPHPFSEISKSVKMSSIFLFPS